MIISINPYVTFVTVIYVKTGCVALEKPHVYGICEYLATEISYVITSVKGHLVGQRICINIMLVEAHQINCDK